MISLSLSLCQVHYESDAKLEEIFSGSSLHLAVVFPGLSGASDIEPLPLVTGLAQKAFLNFAFVLADRLAGPFIALLPPYSPLKQLFLIIADPLTVNTVQGCI